MDELERCVIIDGHSLAYRAFYALPTDLSTSSGQVTNAVYGFTSMLIKILEDLKPQAIMVAFDKGKPEFRLKRYEEYKAHRKPMPDELREQMGIIHAVLEVLGIPCIEEEGFEADDILATLKEILPDDEEIFIVTGDRDALQLVDERVRVVANRKGLTDIIIYDSAKVEERYGVKPSQILDYLALKGDTSDNIPGVPGIGEKTASSLINEYGSVEGVYDNLGKIKSRFRKALEDNRESAEISRELARMRKDVPLGGEIGEASIFDPWNDDGVRELFSTLEFKSLYERLQALKPLLFPGVEGASGASAEFEPSQETIVRGEEQLAGLQDALVDRGELSLYADFDGEGYSRGRITSLSAAIGDRTYFLDLGGYDASHLLEGFLSIIKKVDGLRVNCFRGKEIMVQCARLSGLYPALDFDIQLASYLLNPGVDHDLYTVSMRYLGEPPSAAPEGQLDMLAVEEGRAAGEMRKALALDQLVEPMEADINRRKLRTLYEEVEIPLQTVLADMEIKGVRLDGELLKSMGKEMEGELLDLQERAYEMAGESFNLNSPQQLSHVLFDILELPPQKRIKTGYATDVSVLQALRELHPIADLLLRYRELFKLKNTYVDALPRLLNPRTGRLHASFNQTVTATGRLSSSNPNLQNIPIRTPQGRKIRKAFLPTSDAGTILSADYSQIELRVMAHLSGDDGLIKAFEEELDIHTSTAAEVFGSPFDKVTPEQRRQAKAINFGIIYGISPFGLSDQLGIGQDEAELYIKNYFQRYPGVREYLDAQVEEGRQSGYVTTLMGRRREIPELAAGNIRIRHLGERLAFNTPIQGSAADIIKVAMVRVHRRLEEEGLESGMILQVHDELVLDVEPGEEGAVTALVREEMEGACDLDIPLKVDLGIGPTWYDSK
ncbi:MAG: DNA polymerase I [Actinomycetota bacterium]|nr:DNA polymerase I [Actinomycetota bacterium]